MSTIPLSSLLLLAMTAIKPTTTAMIKAPTKNFMGSPLLSSQPHFYSFYIFLQPFLYCHLLSILQDIIIAMSIRSLFITVFLFLFIAFVGLVFKNLSNLKLEKPASFNTEVRIGDIYFLAKTVSTDIEKKMGLSGTKELKDNQAMLFVFDKADKWSIWMKDMNYPLDIIWLSSEKKIVHIENNISPDTYPKTFYPDAPAMYVLEMPASALEKSNVELGNQVFFEVK